MIVYCIDPSPDAVTNGCLLLGALMMLKFNHSPEEVCRIFLRPDVSRLLPRFRDASYAKQDYDLPLTDCLLGMARAAQLGWFELDNFRVDLYHELEDPSVGGDIHVINHKLVALKSPLAEGLHYDRRRDGAAKTPAFYFPILRLLGVTAVGGSRVGRGREFDRWGRGRGSDLGGYGQD